MRVLWPFTRVGLHGLEKNWISALPWGSFSFSAGRPSASPAPARLPGRPSVSALTMVQRHSSGGMGLFSHLARQVRSKFALKAVLTIRGSVRASTNSAIMSGSASKQSMVRTSSSPQSSKMYEISRMSKSGASV